MKVAIVHYWLVNMRGGEKVLEALLEMFPEADVFTHVYDPESVSPVIRSHRVFTSPVNRLPFARKWYQKYLPFMPGALKAFNLQGYDLVISSEAGPAKGVVPDPDAYHLCYCHSPMRYIWDLYHEYRAKSGAATRFFMGLFAERLRTWDVVSANLVDRFVVNSAYVAKRVRRYYRRDAEVVYPPAAVEKYIGRARKPEDFYLFFGQIAFNKRLDIAAGACAATGRRLVVAGGGVSRRERTRYERSGLVRFLGRVSDDEAADLFARARALLFPGIEDLGLIPIEANAAGCPVIAFRKGGAIETVKENVTGIFFDEQTVASLAAALDRFEAIESSFSDRDAFTRHVQQFSREAFVERMWRVIEERRRV